MSVQHFTRYGVFLHPFNFCCNSVITMMERDSPGAASLASASLLVARNCGLWAHGDREGKSRMVNINISILALPSNLKVGWEVAHIPVTVKPETSGAQVH